MCTRAQVICEVQRRVLALLELESASVVSCCELLGAKRRSSLGEEHTPNH